FRDFEDFGEDQSTRGVSASRSRATPSGGSRTPSAASRATRKPADDEAEEKPPAQGSVEAPPEVAKFTVFEGKDSGKVFELRGSAPLTIGTKEGNAVLLSGEGISRYHA